MIWALIPGPLKRALAWLMVGFSAIAATWGLAKRDARRGAALDAAKDHIKTRERIDNAPNDLPDDTAGLRRWLRERGDR